MLQASGTIIIIIITTFHPSCSDSIIVGIAEVKLFSYACILPFLACMKEVYCNQAGRYYILHTTYFIVTSPIWGLTKVREQNNFLCVCVEEM